MNLQETHRLKKLTEAVTQGKAVTIETQYGKVWVCPTRKPNRVTAELTDINSITHTVWADTPILALLRLGEECRMQGL